MGHRSGKNEFYSGLSMTVLFGGIFLMFKSWWFLIFPLVFAGLLPLARGTGKLLEERSRNRIEPRKQARPLSRDDRERLILKTARNHAGRVSVTLIAVETDMTIAQAEEILEDLVHRGYASLEVRENGGLEYHFPDFLP
jgi:predicted transcriptional regulator